MLAVGDIVQIFASTVGYDKYHLCIAVGVDGAASKFLFLNSDPNFEGVYSVECARVPCLPPSDTGVTAFSFNVIVRYNDNQLRLYKAKKLGVLDIKLAVDLLGFVSNPQSKIALTRPERDIVIAALKAVAGA